MDYMSTRGDGSLPYLSTDPAAAPPLKDHGKITYLDATDAAAPGNPAAGTHRLYSKADGLYYRDSAGVEVGPLGSGGGASGSTYPPLYDHAAKRRLVLYGSGAYSNPANATDGDGATAAGATTGAMPQDAQFDLGDNPPPVGTVHVVYNDAGHRSASGSLDWSDDAVAWTQAVTWAADATTDRWHTFTPVTHRYWRIHTTAAGTGGNGIDIKHLRVFSGGLDKAYGILVSTTNAAPTSPANATDGYTVSKATATTGGTYPITYAVDLGAAYAIVGAHLVFGDEGHSALSGSLQWSDDNATWASVVAWTNEQSAERFYSWQSASHRYWQLRCTAVLGGSGLDVASIEFATAAVPVAPLAPTPPYTIPPPDNATLHPLNATYGDAFAGGALSGIWTPRAGTTAATPTDPRQYGIQLGVGVQGRGILTPIPVGDFEVVTGMYMPPSGDVTIGANAMPAIVAVDSSGNGWGVCPYNSPNNIFGMSIAAYIYSATVLNPAFAVYPPFGPMPTYWALCRAGTNLKFRYSRDGVAWSAYSANIAIGATVLDRIGFLRLFTNGDSNFGLTRWNVYAPAYVP